MLARFGENTRANQESHSRFFVAESGRHRLLGSGRVLFHYFGSRLHILDLALNNIGFPKLPHYSNNHVLCDNQSFAFFPPFAVSPAGFAFGSLLVEPVSLLLDVLSFFAAPLKSSNPFIQAWGLLRLEGGSATYSGICAEAIAAAILFAASALVLSARRRKRNA